MSGGSFNYLYAKGADEILGAPELEEMAKELDDLGHLAKAPAQRTRELLTLRDRIQTEIEQLAPIWHAVEWWRSADWSRDQVIAELGAWRERNKDGGR